MTEQKEVSRAAAGAAARQRDEDYLVPPVDVYEDDSGIRITADLPGVSAQGLNVEVDHDTLVIEGNIDVPVPEGLTPQFADIPSGRYWRSFSLSSELDTESVEANLKDGVLAVRLAKKKAHQPRKIEVRAD